MVFRRCWHELARRIIITWVGYRYGGESCYGVLATSFRSLPRRSASSPGLQRAIQGMGVYKTPALLILRKHLRHRGVSLHRCFSTKSSEALRILFCGSDEFSIASLKALHAEHLQRPESIESIEVVCRPGKRVGRGLKQIREGIYATHILDILQFES